MLKLSSYTIARRLTILTLSAGFGIIVLAFMFLMSERSLIMEERQNGVRQTVETAHGLLTQYHAAAIAGKMPEADAKLLAMNAIRGLRYSSSEYFWINDMQTKMVMHPIRPEL